MSLDGKLEFIGVTDVGRKRAHNEDSIGSDSGLGIAVLADGMGGYRAGEVASAMAVNMILDDVRDGMMQASGGGTDEETGFCRETVLIKTAIEKANATIYQTAQRQPQCHGMGTTVVALAFYDDRMSIAHVGDSRIYRMRDAHLRQVTSDHSLLQELIDRGFYTPEEAKKSLNKNLVTRAMGIEMAVNPDLQEGVVQPGDIYLMCSDGLTDLVEDDVIHETLVEYADSLEDAAQHLVDKANAAGGADNISVILVRSLKPFGTQKKWVNKVRDWF
jgi:serine/threonine protein phosphatase PrpC